MTTTPPVPLPTMHAPSGSDLDSWYEILLGLTSPLTPYVPVISASTTNPTTSAATGSYMQLGKFVTGRALLTISTAGSGNYFVTAPVNTNEATGESAGSALFFDTSAGTRYPLSVFWIASTTVSFGIPGTGGRLTNVAPVTVAAGDQISIKWNFEGA